MNSYPNPERALQGPDGRHASIGHMALTWLGYCFDVFVGITAGTAVTFVGIMGLAPVLYLWALWAGSILALAIWIVTVIVCTVRAHSRGWTSGTIRFLAGFAIIPCYLGIEAIITLSLYGWGNPIVG